MLKSWREELARDLIALGGVPFLLITIIRVLPINVYYPLEFVLGASIFFILKIFFKAQLHAGIGLILFCFTSLFYGHLLFTIFAFLLYLGIIISLFYLGHSRKEIIKGIVFGALSSGLSYWLVRLIFF